MPPEQAALRLLACVPAQPLTDPSCVVAQLTAEHLQHAPGVQASLLAGPCSTEQLSQRVSDFKPTALYLAASVSWESPSGALQPFEFEQGAGGPAAAQQLITQISQALASCSSITLIYLDARAGTDEYSSLCELQAAASDRLEIVAWPPAASSPPATTAALFAHCFWTIMLTYSTRPSEAFAFARNVSNALATTGAPPEPPRLPAFMSAAKPELPGYFSVRPLQSPLEGLAVDATGTAGQQTGQQQNLAVVIPGWRDLRLLAPRSELFCNLCGGAGLLEVGRLSDLGESLRALLVLEVSQLTLVSSASCQQIPLNLPPYSSAIRCEISTTSGARAAVVLGGPQDILKECDLVEHALRLTMASDAQSLQFCCSPPTEQPDVPTCLPSIAASTPTVPVRILTSIWAVQVLRQLSQMPNNLSLISLGVAAVSSAAVQGAPPSLTRLLKMIISGAGPDVHPPEVRQIDPGLPRIPSKGPAPSKSRGPPSTQSLTAAESSSPVASAAVKKEREDRAAARAALKAKRTEDSLQPEIKQEQGVAPAASPDWSPAGPGTAPALQPEGTQEE